MERTIKRKEFVFQAGEMIIENGKAKANSDKGEIKLYTNPDGLLCFEWKNLIKNTTSEPIAILAGDWLWKKIGSQKGRVYLLENIMYSEIKYFYWMQFNAAMDDNISTIVSNILKTGTLEIDESKMPNESKSMSIMDVEKEEEKKSQLSTAVPVGSQQGNQAQQVKTQPQQQPNMDNNDFIKQFAASMKQFQMTLPDLGKVLTTSTVNEFIATLDQNTVDELIKLLPETQQNKQALYDNISSPQFQQALEQLTSALNSENLTAILQSFQLNLSTAQKSPNGVEAFIKCIIEKFKKN